MSPSVKGYKWKSNCVTERFCPSMAKDLTKAASVESHLPYHSTFYILWHLSRLQAMCSWRAGRLLGEGLETPLHSDPTAVATDLGITAHFMP